MASSTDKSNQILDLLHPSKVLAYFEAISPSRVVGTASGYQHPVTYYLRSFGQHVFVSNVVIFDHYSGDPIIGSEYQNDFSNPSVPEWLEKLLTDTYTEDFERPIIAQEFLSDLRKYIGQVVA